MTGFALLIFEAAALLVSSLSSQVSRHVRELEWREIQQKKLYELSQQVLLLNRDSNTNQQLADLIRTSLHAQGIALWNAYEMQLCKSGSYDLSDEQVRGVYFHEVNDDNSDGSISQRVLRLGTRPIGALVLSGHSLDSASVDAVGALTAITIERARHFRLTRMQRHRNEVNSSAPPSPTDTHTLSRAH